MKSIKRICTKCKQKRGTTDRRTPYICQYCEDEIARNYHPKAIGLVCGIIGFFIGEVIALSLCTA